MDGDCFTCQKPLGTEVCIFDSKYYHKSCCQFCKHHFKAKLPLARRPLEPIFTKENTPPEAIPLEPKIEEPKRPTKVKSTPGRLNFAKYEILANIDVKCFTCKLTIYGQRFLSKKIGQFNCLDCHIKLSPKCHLCKITFETGQSVFKDENQNKYCEKCINIYYNDLKQKKLEEQLNKKQFKRQQSDANFNNVSNEQLLQRQISENNNGNDGFKLNLQEQGSNYNSYNNSSNNIDMTPSQQEKQLVEKQQSSQVNKTSKKSKSKSKSKSPTKSPYNSSPSSPVMSPKTNTKRFKTFDYNNNNNSNNNTSNKKQINLQIQQQQRKSNNVMHAPKH